MRRFLLFAAVGAVVCSVHPPTASAGAGDALRELASRYAPVVRLSEQQAPCARGEAFLPIDVNAIFDNDEVTLRGPAGFVKVAPAAADVASDHEGYSLDFPGNALSSSACSYEEWERRITSRRAPTVYAHVATESGKLALQYWFFYVYNDFNNKHEGDWELIQLDFDASTPAAALRTRPFEVGYSQHAAAERAEWSSPKLELVEGTHPVVYPAEGSHANYFSAALFLGRSAAQGVGCDNTSEPWSELRPNVDVIPEDARAAHAEFPWLGYEGRWGERRRGFYDAPTGPNTKDEWTRPLTWADETWRSKSFALAGGRSLGPTATKFFCRAVGGASTALLLVANHPSASVAVVAIVVVILLWLATRTRWRAGPSTELRQPRSWGALVTAAARIYRRNVRLFLAVGAIFAALGVLVAVLQYLVFRLSGLSTLVDAFGRSNGLTEVVVLGFGIVLNVLGLVVAQAACARVVVALDESGRVSAAEAYRATLARLAPLFGGLVLLALVNAVLDLTLVGLPIAVWLTIRWSLLAQAVVLEGESATGALRRSAGLVRGQWWRTASLTVFVTGVALLLGPFVGALLLLATSASFDVVNLASDLVYVFVLPFAAVATTYLYFDLLSRHERTV